MLKRCGHTVYAYAAPFFQQASAQIWENRSTLDNGLKDRSLEGQCAVINENQNCR